MARFSVTLNVTYLTFINGLQVATEGTRGLGHQLGAEHGVATEADANEWVAFLIVGGRFCSADESYAYTVNSAVVSPA